MNEMERAEKVKDAVERLAQDVLEGKNTLRFSLYEAVLLGIELGKEIYTEEFSK